MVEAVFDAYGSPSDGEPMFDCSCGACGTRRLVPLSRMLKIEVRNQTQALVLGPATGSYRVSTMH
jgi:hypothetical protein